jgi:hypothetical protein
MDELEARVDELIAKMAQEFADLGKELRFTLARALIHRAVHHAAVRPSAAHQENFDVEFCAVTTYLAEMIGHAHQLMHGNNPKAPAHRDVMH